MPSIDEIPWWARLIAGAFAAFGAGYLAAELKGGIAALVTYLGGVAQKRPNDVIRETAP